MINNFLLKIPSKYLFISKIRVINNNIQFSHLFIFQLIFKCNASKLFKSNLGPDIFLVLFS